MDIRCGDCGEVLAGDAATCPTCGRTLGSKPAGRRPALLVWAAVAAAFEVALTLVIFRSCG
jgi:uncharacterized OB-fold protein